MVGYRRSISVRFTTGLAPQQTSSLLHDKRLVVGVGIFVLLHLLHVFGLQIFGRFPLSSSGSVAVNFTKVATESQFVCENFRADPTLVSRQMGLHVITETVSSV